MKRIYFSTCYDSDDSICGYVIPKEESDDYYVISTKQYLRALKKRTIGGDAGIKFHADKPVYVQGVDFQG